MFLDLAALLFYLIVYLYSWGRWNEINEQGQFKRGWAITDIEDCARVIVSIAFAKLFVSIFSISMMITMLIVRKRRFSLNSTHSQISEIFPIKKFRSRLMDILT